MGCLLVGCHSSSLLYDSRYNPPVHFGTHVVRSGETLYSIARRYGRDYFELAGANGIKAPYRIQPGQKINLELTLNGPEKGESRVAKTESQVSNVTEGKSRNNLDSSVTKNKNHKNIKNIKWAWPHVGPILATYTFANDDRKSKLGNKGIDIGGKLGEPVYAAASGEVVYSGNGLLGYGNLVIITHDDRYLSAYAHNRRNLVTEGQLIEPGQKIAELGDSGTDQPKLHFEIRQDGRPVDPLKYLPIR
jgi:lipoprotein NlpD